MRERAQEALHPLLYIAVFISIATLTGAAATGRPATAQALADLLQTEIQQPRFNSRVDLAMLPVSVLDSDDLPVEGLSSEDFVMVEDGVEQEVAILLSPRDAPLDIAVLMDVSNSMRRMEKAARSSAIQFLDQLSDDDCVLLLRFRETAGPAIWGSPGDPVIRSAINEPPPTGRHGAARCYRNGFPPFGSRPRPLSGFQFPGREQPRSATKAPGHGRGNRRPR